MSLRKIARIIRAAGTDAEIARRTSHSPEFRKAVTKDRRAALSQYTTVKHALRDRERILAAAAAPKGRGKAAASRNGRGESANDMKANGRKAGARTKPTR